MNSPCALMVSRSYPAPGRRSLFTPDVVVAAMAGPARSDIVIAEIAILVFMLVSSDSLCATTVAAYGINYRGTTGRRRGMNMAGARSIVANDGVVPKQSPRRRAGGCIRGLPVQGCTGRRQPENSTLRPAASGPFRSAPRRCPRYVRKGAASGQRIAASFAECCVR